MKKLLGYLPFHFLLFLIAGICCQYYTDFWNFGIVRFFCILLFLGFIGYLFRKTVLFIFISWLSFFLIGILLIYRGDATKNYNYFEKHLTNTSNATLAIDKVLKPGNYHYKYMAEVLQIDHQKTTGRVLINIEKDSVASFFKIGDRILIKNKFVAIKESLNPHQFNYKNYLAKQGIHQQVYATKQELLLLDQTSTSFLEFIAAFRLKIQQSLQQYDFSEDELAIMNALLLGQRQDISKELTANYSKAGAIHILAVSGLHVGIILWMLSFVLKPLERYKKGKVIKLVLLVLFLWFFAVLAGMSASVTRAVTMFSAIAIGQFFNKRNAIEQSLIFSMFLLLLLKPLFLFDVGFQLSYLAVFGIIWVQPVFYQLWKPKYYIIDKGWQLITVSTAAQLGVLPISLFYFHQFPGLFFLSNLLIIPFLGVILGAGIIVLGLSYLTILPVFLVDIYSGIISILNRLVAFIARQEAFLFSDISFSFIKMFFSYLVIIACFQFFLKRNAKRCLFFLSSVLIFQFVFFCEKYHIEKNNEFIVFHKSRNSIVGIRTGSFLEVYNDMDSLVTKQNLLKNYKVGENILYQNYQKLPTLLQLNKQIVLFIDTAGVYNLTDLHQPIVLLHQSPKINLERLINRLQPTIIIADGSNYKSYVRRWKATCLKLQIPFWSTNEQGAYIKK
ncbi:ComEC family competence protein [Flavobacteriaceae bacterium]|nr:ComEC family competence protein [Flavobacteriaceae bacterium]MDB9927194.1 ComEC family competence protein [Flavobacteriaceae bacterium]MDB9955755.1 ComEC family competence protein [Flavobacteriaceae bacterium]